MSQTDAEPYLLIQPEDRPVTVVIGTTLIAHTEAALKLSEGRYPPIFYVPAADVDFSRLERSDHKTHCSYKGECSYYHIRLTTDDFFHNVVWVYENPFEAVSAIKDHLAFYPNHADIILRDCA